MDQEGKKQPDDESSNQKGEPKCSKQFQIYAQEKERTDERGKGQVKGIFSLLGICVHKRSFLSVIGPEEMERIPSGWRLPSSCTESRGRSS